MKKLIVFFAVIVFNSGHCLGQKSNFFASGAINIPLGDFSTSHWIGIGAEVFSIKYDCDTGKQKMVSITYKAGASYYFAGQRQVVNRYSYDYPSFFYTYASAGILFRPYQRLNVAVTAGPALSVYKKISRFNIAGGIDASYFIHCNMSVGPTLFMIKETGADPLWALGLKLNLRL